MSSSDVQQIVSGVSQAVTNITASINSNVDAIDVSIDNAVTTITGKIDTSTRALGTALKTVETQVRSDIILGTSAINSRLALLKNDLYQKLANDTLDIAGRINYAQKQIGSLLDEGVVKSKQTVDKAFKDVKDFSSKQGEDIKGRLDRSDTAQSEAIKGLSKDILQPLVDVGTNLSLLPETISEQIGNQLVEMFAPFLGDLSTRTGQFKTILDKVLKGQYTDGQQIVADLTGGQADSIVVQAIVYLGLGFPIVLGALGALASPYVANIQRLTLTQALPNRADVTALTILKNRGTLTVAQYNQEMAKLGFNSVEADKINAASRPLMSVDAIRQAYLRKLIDQPTHDRLLTQYGMFPYAIDIQKALYNLIPPVQDIITMAVREAFSPTIAQKFGQYENFPESVLPFTRAQGLTDEWVRRYWAAHWSLPSPMQGFEMLHRGVIDKSTLTQLMQALDIMPYWRDKLIAIAYTPFTRVDIRRMYSADVLNEQEVYRAYLDIGYNPDKAKKLTEFTIKLEQGEDFNLDDEIKKRARKVYEVAYKRGALSRKQTITALKTLGGDASDIGKLLDIFDYEAHVANTPDKTGDYGDRTAKLVSDTYARGVISRHEAIAHLKGIGFSDKEADTELDFADYEYDTAFRRTVVNTIKTLYLQNTIDANTLVTKMGQLGFSHNEIAQLQREVNILKHLRTDKPTKAELAKFLKKGIIVLDEYINEMRGIGYDDKYINWYLADSGYTGE